MKELAVVRPHRGQFRPEPELPAGDGDDPPDEFPDAPVLRGDHRDDGDAEGLLQGVGIDPDPLFLRHVQHVHRDDDRRAQEEELRQEVEAPLEDGGIHQKDDDIGRFMDDEVAGDPLLLRECRQAVGAGEIDDAEFVSFRRVGALLLLDGLSRPVADVLRKPRQDVENRRFSRIGLAGEGDEKRFGLRRFPLPFARGGEPVDEDLRGLAVSQGDPRFGRPGR